mgnify:CR=1 FL=1
MILQSPKIHLAWQPLLLISLILAKHGLSQSTSETTKIKMWYQYHRPLSSLEVDDDRRFFAWWIFWFLAAVSEHDTLNLSPLTEAFNFFSIEYQTVSSCPLFINNNWYVNRFELRAKRPTKSGSNYKMGRVKQTRFFFVIAITVVIAIGWIFPCLPECLAEDTQRYATIGEKQQASGVISILTNLLMSSPPTISMPTPYLNSDDIAYIWNI